MPNTINKQATAIEDRYWGELAMQAKSEGVFKGDAMAELMRIAKDKGVSLDTND
ncbi:hypothetical protein BegalDRAFT_3567 [Beggiatoa alba B18LD]|uniref:Uncharacterized protein n=1 Tax=Beggiatoa alba B18LD TaxID=395493 RepID=I3CBE0_9GAMM|nr:hypothetical protein [Beggiatoa alba]EIJ40933.1 hypothetical protein BegalDRAFT_3567 [Beggiatoa alba B18LD]